MFNHELSKKTRQNILLLAFLALIFVAGNIINSTAVNLILIALGLGLASFVMLKKQVSDRYLIFWEFMVFLLFGYQFFGKGFANLELSPIFIGEIGILLAVLVVLFTLRNNLPDYIARLRKPMPMILLVFMIFHGIRSVFDVPRYPVADVFRDSVIWAYAVFAIAIYLLIPVKKIDQFVKLYGALIPYYLVITFILWPLNKIYNVNIMTPLSDISLIEVRSDNAGFHLAGVAAYLVLIYPYLFSSRWISTITLWILWALDWIVFGVSNRAATLSALSGLILSNLWRLSARGLVGLVVVASVVSLFLASNIEIDYKDSVGQQDLSTSQFTENFISLIDIAFGTDIANNSSDNADNSSDTIDNNDADTDEVILNDTEVLHQTVEWRMNWWKEVVNYTIFGDYFWQGKGYGVNLAADDGFLYDAETTRLNRYPHNISMSFLARSGVIGFGLWVVFVLAYIVHMLMHAIKYRKNNLIIESNVVAWLLIFWLCLLFSASFSVIIEGPMGGIWFWSLTGIGLAYTIRTKIEPNHPATA